MSENDILEVIGDERAILIVTPMGGQGYVFGRGNQQLSANVLRKIDKKDIIIIITHHDGYAFIIINTLFR